MTTATTATNIRSENERKDAIIATLNALTPTERYSTVGDACLVEAAYAYRLRYVPAWKCWIVYRAGRWSRDAGEEHAGQLVEETLRIVAHHAADDLHTDDGKKLNTHVARSFDKVHDITLAARRRPDLMIDPRDLDTHLDLLNVANGIVNLETGALTPHDPALLLTRQAPVIYHEDWARAGDWARVCPTWLRFLDDVFEHDAAVVAWMQRVLGYCLTGRTDEQVMFMAYGRGRNGKSVMNELMQRILGEYAATIKPETLVKQSANGFRNENSPDPELARLPGVRLAVSSEPPNTSDTKAGITDDARVKLITGSERISVRAHYGHSFEYVPQFKVMLAVNRLPRRQEHTEGSERRMLTIPYNVRFVPGQNADPLMAEKLWAEREGILAWLVAGAMQWYATRKTTPLTVNAPQVVAESNEEYKREQDPYRAFFMDELVREDGVSLLLADAFNAFMKWRMAHREELLDALGIGHDKLGYRSLPTITQRGFTELAGERGFVRKHTKHGAAFIGVRLYGEKQSAADGGDEPVTEVTENTPNNVNSSREDDLEEFTFSPLDSVTSVTTPLSPEAPAPKIVPVLTPGTPNRRYAIEQYGSPVDAAGAPLVTEGCRHPHAAPTPPGWWPDPFPGDETWMRCPDCLDEFGWHPLDFLCGDVSAHRAQWDALGCPICDAAFAVRWPAERPAREARAAAQKAKSEHLYAEWKAKHARAEAIA